MLNRRSLLALLVVSATTIFAQGTSPRLNDKDVERLMKNLNQDTKNFEKSFKKALGQSSVRKTSREKDLQSLAKRLINQTDGMAKEFNRKKKADTTLPVVYQTVNEIQKSMTELNLQGVVSNDWQKITAELKQIADQFSYTPPAS